MSMHAYDDVGVDSLRLIEHKMAAAFTQRLRTPPYSFQVPLPAFDSSNGANNRITPRWMPSTPMVPRMVIWTSTGPKSRPPLNWSRMHSVAIAEPSDGRPWSRVSTSPAGLNVVDDAGVDRVSLNAAGLLGGTRRLGSDTLHPMSFTPRALWPRVSHCSSRPGYRASSQGCAHRAGPAQSHRQCE